MRPSATGPSEAGAPSEAEDDDVPEAYVPQPTKRSRQETGGGGSAKRGRGSRAQTTPHINTKALEKQRMQEINTSKKGSLDQFFPRVGYVFHSV